MPRDKTIAVPPRWHAEISEDEARGQLGRDLLDGIGVTAEAFVEAAVTAAFRRRRMRIMPTSA
jgi:hypothetical protein